MEPTTEARKESQQGANPERFLRRSPLQAAAVAPVHPQGTEAPCAQDTCREPEDMRPIGPVIFEIQGRPFPCLSSLAL